jgi:hypothetical protein
VSSVFGKGMARRRSANAWGSLSLCVTHAGAHHSQPLNRAHSMVAHLMQVIYS